MIEATIHGRAMKIAVYQGVLSSDARHQLVRQVVRMCEAYPEDEFLAATEDDLRSLQGGPALTKLLNHLDSALASGYIKRYADDFAPIASIKTIG